MDLNGVKDELYALAARFFGGATVLWEEQTGTRPPLPYLTLKCGSVDRAAFEVGDSDGGVGYQSSTILEANLYTRGKRAGGGEGESGSWADTAPSDLAEFANYMESDRVADVLAGKGISIALMPPIRDVSYLENGAGYRYRAMAEFSVSFPQETAGAYRTATAPLVPNSSGGGTGEEGKSPEDSINIVEIAEGGVRNG